jgi:hypothetical protein
MVGRPTVNDDKPKAILLFSFYDTYEKFLELNMSNFKFVCAGMARYYEIKLGLRGLQ